MKDYISKEVVQAVVVKWSHGFDISEVEPAEGERYPAAKDVVHLPTEFIRDNPIKVGCVIIFKRKQPVEMLINEDVFNVLYKPAPASRVRKK